MMNRGKYKYEWTLRDAIFTKDKGKVFSCFACGGGSTMGYKLAGFDVIGCNEIDPKMNEIYVENHNPKYNYLQPIQEFKNSDNLPEELYNLDILDGSPPCSTFSMSGNRDSDWGKKKKFKEGQAKQVLDTLFFDFIDLGKRLQPKVIIAENVKGIIQGKAKKYVINIHKALKEAGYQSKHFLLNGKYMGLPQARQRVFFIAVRNDLVNKLPKDNSSLFSEFPLLDLHFNYNPILFKEIREYGVKGLREKFMKCHKKLYLMKKEGDTSLCDSFERKNNKKGFFNNSYTDDNKVLRTISAHRDNATNILHDEMRYLSEKEFLRGSSFPMDYNFLKENKGYIMGMSVPPVMTANISDRIYNQWKKIF